MNLRARIQQLREHADILSGYGMDESARMLGAVAEKLETDVDELEETPIGRAVFARAAGVHPDSVTRAVRDGRVTLTVGDISKVQPHKKPRNRTGAALTIPGTSRTLDEFTRKTVASSSKGRA